MELIEGVDYIARQTRTVTEWCGSCGKTFLVLVVGDIETAKVGTCRSCVYAVGAEPALSPNRYFAPSGNTGADHWKNRSDAAA